MRIADLRHSANQCLASIHPQSAIRNPASSDCILTMLAGAGLRIASFDRNTDTFPSPNLPVRELFDYGIIRVLDDLFRRG